MAVLENSARVAQSCVYLRVEGDNGAREREREKGNERNDNFPRRIDEERTKRERERKREEKWRKTSAKGGKERESLVRRVWPVV